MPIRQFTLPTPPPHPTDHSYPSFRKWLLEYSDRLLNYMNGWTTDLTTSVNNGLNGYGADIPSAAAITVTNMTHQVTGTTTVSTIQQPQGQSAVGPLVLIAKDGFSINTGGNVLNSLTVAAGHSAWLSYHPDLQKWSGVVS